MVAKLTVKSQRKPSKHCLGNKPRRFYDQELWLSVRSMELTCNSHKAPTQRCRGKMLSPSSEKPFWKASSEALSAEALQGDEHFHCPADCPSWVTWNLTGSQIKLSSLLSITFPLVCTCTSCNPTGLSCYFLPALGLELLTHLTVLLCAFSSCWFTSLVRNLSAISLFAWSPLEWEKPIVWPLSMG